MSRSLRKSQYIEKNFFDLEKKTNIIIPRQNLITRDFLDLEIKIYNGIRFYNLIVTEKMLGHKFGEFSPTRRIAKHKKKKK
jgi:small subunit ribosomal protein S19